MGMTIDEENKFMEESKKHFKEWHDMNYIPRADYENRLKADLVATLTELKAEIEELDSRAGYDGNGMPTFSTDYIRKNKVNELIQQKINSLKENKV